jgi:protein-tyrosine phosphatase
MELRESRGLVWEGCVNVRDLGGHSTDDGRQVAYGRVVRADSVRQLSQGGWKALGDYGITRIVDLRWHEELEADPPSELPVEVVHIPLFGRPQDVDPIDELVAPLEDPVQRKIAYYRECLGRFPNNFGTAIAAVGEAPAGGVVVHCAGGVDRTGLVSALLLRLAGVTIDDIAADYAVSEENWAPFREQWIEEAATPEEKRWRRLWSAIPAEVMTGTLEELEARYGSVREYLRSAGVSDAVLERVRARLVG